MEPVEEYAQLKPQITQLQARTDQVRYGFFQPSARLRSNQAETMLRLQARRVFVKRRLPAEILRNPANRDQRRSMIVTVRPADDTRPEQDGQLTEPIDLFPPPRFTTTHPGAAPS
ncbi:hypothetical protein GCM10010873_05350 [Cypionkella aquatica]|uniref:Uncharacterized protein n=1 Tax=Cypionkella aquatica TaxID=1756042 RepID=A0AA37WYV8_9RHOB|nr:hypothetical protein [Cypionkella aquatica]GLS85562.1 hypothetical protein GCM10010873_05350 [Cypionkella aquatica]